MKSFKLNHMKEVTTKEVYINEYGKEKLTTNGYIVDTLLFAEAEKKIAANLEGNKYEIRQIKVSPYDEYLLEQDTNRYFKVVVTFIDIDDSGHQKKMKVNYLVAAENQEDAVGEVNTHNKNSVANWEITALKETNIIDVV